MKKIKLKTAEDILSHRTKLGISQRAYGELYGVPKSTVNNWEHGITEVNGHFEGAVNYFENNRK